MMFPQFLDDGRLLQITAGIKVSSKHVLTDGKQNEQEIISTPLYVPSISIFSHCFSLQFIVIN